MKIENIYTSQRKLNRVDQLLTMIETLNNEKDLPKINLTLCEDGEIQIKDGHHRLTAILLSGRKELKRYEYILLTQDQFKPRFERMKDFVKKYALEANLVKALV